MYYRGMVNACQKFLVWPSDISWKKKKKETDFWVREALLSDQKWLAPPSPLPRSFFQIPPIREGRVRGALYLVHAWCCASACEPRLRHCGKHWLLLMITKNTIDRWPEKQTCGNRLRKWDSSPPLVTKAHILRCQSWERYAPREKER